MLAHSRGRRMINGVEVDYDPNVEITAAVMEQFFSSATIEAQLLALVDRETGATLEGATLEDVTLDPGPGRRLPDATD